MRHPDSKLVLFTGAGFLFLWLDVSLGHVGAGLKHPGMWLPLVFLPCAAVSAMLTACQATRTRRRLFSVLCSGAILIGFLGFAFHAARLVRDLKGVIQWEVLSRLMRYPPLFAPLAVSGLGMLGLFVSHVDEGVAPYPRDRSRDPQAGEE